MRDYELKLATSRIPRYSVAAVVFLTIVLVTLPQNIHALPQQTTGPYIASPKYQPIMLWDIVSVMFDVTDHETGTQNVTLFYSSKSTPVEAYIPKPMELVSGDEYSGSYSAQIPPFPTGTTVFSYVRVVDMKGETRSSEPQELYRVASAGQPSFRLQDLQLKDINLETPSPTLDIETAIEAYAPYFGENEPETIRVDLYVYWLGSFRELRSNTVRHMGERFRYMQRIAWDELPILGDPSLYPLDHYDVNLTFTMRYGNSNEIEGPERIWFKDYAMEKVWNVLQYVVCRTNGDHMVISISLSLTRRIENAYPIMLPLMSSFVMLDSATFIQKLINRLTLFLALFVFFVGFSPRLGAFVPPLTLGPSLAEMMLTSLALYVAIFLISSVWSNFAQKYVKTAYGRTIVSLSFDAGALVLILSLLQTFVLMRTSFFADTLWSAMERSTIIDPTLIALALVAGIVIRAALFLLGGLSNLMRSLIRLLRIDHEKRIIVAG